MTPQIARPPGTPGCEQDDRALLLGNGERTRTASTSRGRKNDPLYRARRTLHTGAGLLTDKQTARLTAMFSIDEHVEVEATWGIYQRMIAAYRHPDPAAGRELTVKLIESLSAGVPRPLVEIAKLGRTLSKRAADVVAYYFDRPCTSNGPTEAIYELAGGWSGTGWSGWFRSRCLACDSRSNWPVWAVSSG